MDTVLRDAFIDVCINHYQNILKAKSSNNNQEIYGVPPESIIIVIGSSHHNKDWFPISKKESAFRYDNHGLTEVAIESTPDRTVRGMYYKQAYAELCIQENGIAFMMIQLGQRYAKCYRYLIINDGGKTRFSDEKLM